MRKRALPNGMVAVGLLLAAALTPTPAVAAAAPPTVGAGAVMPHLTALQEIADRNGDTRAAGTPGYTESVRYVKGVLDRAGFRTRIDEFVYVDEKGVRHTSQNVIADWPGGDDNDVVMVGAHLDSVPAGPGINDNGSGAAAVLATAEVVARAHLVSRRHLRFAWWGAEELGELGSAAYLKHLPSRQRKAIGAYLNFDMTGIDTTGMWLVVDTGDGLAKGFYDYFAVHDIPTWDIGVGSSDHVSFADRGIPVSGFTTGIDACYHLACDRLENISPTVQTTSTNAIIYALWGLSDGKRA
ncbi:M20/M25/M40 family metallo-hydrolase [Micromonospora sp. WMMD710]|uniref:M20/M25/M40 family metallo-hydrolase n=1 Tax=Micromonospora sp. WMMD710 TaxID=3016085 RepID=UPI002416C2A1|nr:M20/M25/M40 family metallo-hydrolase [Micromonospora sp. WMMD710]MDG4761091.1 M20/M25/M40 family metallo-hydrolase [Micromonospora sp. WMMD710]